MGLVEKPLVIRVRVHGDHVALHDAVAVLQNLGDRSQAVRGARGAADDLMLGRVEAVAVDADDERAVDVALAGRADDHALRTRVEMRLSRFLRAEQTGALEDDLRSELAPLELRGVTFRRHGDALVADPDRAVVRFDRVAEVPMDRVPLEQVSQHLRAGQVVDSDDLDVVTPCCDTGHTTADASEAIDSDFRRHSLDSLCAATRSECAAQEGGT